MQTSIQTGEKQIDIERSEIKPERVVTGSRSSVPPYKLLDTWRGLASLWVLMYHAALVFCMYYPVLNSNLFYTFSKHGDLGVRIFFVLSGYVIAHSACANIRSNKGTGAFAFARCRRIYPPLWCALTLHILLTLLATYLVHKHILKSSGMAVNSVLQHSAFEVFANYTLTSLLISQNLLMIVTWTLCFEVAFYALVAVGLIIAYRLKSGERTLLNILHLLTIGCLAALIFAPLRMMHFYPFNLWPQFGMGVAVYDVLQNSRRVVSKLSGLTICIMTLIYVIMRDDSVGILPSHSRETFLFSLIFAFVLIVLYPVDNYLANLRIMKPGAALGLISYSLYLTHYMVIGVVAQTITKLKLTVAWHLITFPLLMGSAIVFAWVFFMLFERPFVNSHSASAVKRITS